MFFRFTLTLTFVLALSAVSVFAGGTGGTTGGGDALTNAKSLLASAATAGGGLWAIWGLVQLGMAIKDHNGPGIGGAIWQLIGGASNPLRNTRHPCIYQICPTNL